MSTPSTEGVTHAKNTRLAHKRRRSWLLLRGPLRLVLVLGCGVSLMGSGRLTPRLVIDGAVSFAFVPLFELVAFALVYRMRTRHLPSPDDVDRFFTTNTPWMFCIVALSALVSLQAPRDIARWTVPPLVVAPMGAVALAVVRATYQDVVYFREELQRSTAAATRDAMLLRAITWPAAAIYFLGVAIWPHLVSWVRP